ncbi:phosphatidate cytidylyltransferase [Dyella tabacisoli]|uniref:Phosphatidate cytidylyltransferase n=1 Tax=Dyella tabacisoli TaxID=2282381 RepID=A0A369UM33_9GAMM|nr:phosphatidate cytidylyltransferase [Dyella tabacisoli]RDD81656.1 phosphatidate cytidylyltransferase [Dyella tabacisoli]
MLLQRTLTALTLAPLAILLILWPPTWVFAPIVAAIFLVAVWEWTRLSGLQQTAARVALLALATVLFGLTWRLQNTALSPLMLAIGVAWWLLVCLWLRHFAFGAAPTRENLQLKLLAGAFVVFPAWIAALALHGGAQGHWWTFLAMLIICAADIGAYFSGRFFGRRKLAPTISPGKTWAGVYGAFVAGALVAVIGGWLLGVRGGPLFGLVLLSVVTVIASVVGDLLESLMKRHAAVKDSGNLFPGHGGLLDRMDSVFAALPIFAAGKLLLGL